MAEPIGIRGAIRRFGVVMVALVAIVAAPKPAWGQGDTAAPRIYHEPCGAYAAGADVEILAVITDASSLFDPKVIYRDSRGNWRPAPFEPTGDGRTFRARIPKTLIKGKLLYFIESFDEHGNGPGRHGSAEEPMAAVLRAGAEPCEQVPSSNLPRPRPRGSGGSTEEVRAAPPLDPEAGKGGKVDLDAEAGTESSCDGESPAWYCGTWVWVAGGALVAVGVGVGLFLYFGGAEEAPDRVTLEVSAPFPTEALRQGP